MKPLTLALALLSFTALAGSPDQDPIAKLYKDRFEAAAGATFEDVILGNTNGGTNKKWNCHTRSLKLNDFTSKTNQFSFFPYLPEIILERDYYFNYSNEYFYMNGELQHVKNSRVKTDRDPSIEVETLSFITLKMDGSNMMFELAVAPVAGYNLIGYDVESVMTGNVKTKVVSIGSCTPNKQ